VADAETDRWLGAAALANDGAELVPLDVDPMNAEALYEGIRDAVPIPLTLAEAVQSAVSALDRVPRASSGPSPQAVAKNR
jgi:hypothetical protein